MNTKYLPKFTITLDKNLDRDCFIEYFNVSNPMIGYIFPNIKTKAEVLSTIENNYDNSQKNIEATVKFINNNKPTLERFALIISKSFNYEWDGIKEITIVPAVCPVCPRFIEDNKFMVAYYFNTNSILRICAHEMTHILYFKKLRELLPDQTIDTEYPGRDWLLSEIVAPIITNRSEIQALVSDKDELIIPDDINVSDVKIKKITELFHKESDLKIFREKALGELSL